MQIHEIMDAVGGKIFHIYCQQYHRSRWLYVIFQDFYSVLKLVNDDFNACYFILCQLFQMAAVIVLK
jgi:hypothetical protein